ncbi:MAG: class I SAM-dependent methyltransferase [Simkaniaceae bacterium]|nr:class I SAM-dependent methyltransferase [Simkaniaceae bacterium]
MNTVQSYNKYTRRLQALVYAIQYPRALKKALQDSVSLLYSEGVSKKAKIKQKLLSEITNIELPIALQNFSVREGNVTSFELMALALMVANKKPKTLLEIGTFDGNTTLQIALNSPVEATIHTIDLPSCGEQNTHLPILQEDVKFVQDKNKLMRKYIGSSVEGKIQQHFGDSTAYEFAKFTDSGLIDFCFIDGGHSYDCVKSDTENVFQIMNPKGIVMWHDFTPNCPGVYKYLSQLSKTKDLVHISGTHLVFSIA